MNEQINIRIHKIREILERFDKNNHSPDEAFYCMSGFPTGCCGDETNLIGLYLLKIHNIKSTYVSGRGLAENPRETHAWLECQGYIIDITADQFNKRGYNLPPVIIEEKSQFHECFNKYEKSLLCEAKLKNTAISSALEIVVSELRNYHYNK